VLHKPALHKQELAPGMQAVELHKRALDKPAVDRQVAVLHMQALGKRAADRKVAVPHMLALGKRALAARMWVEERDRRVEVPGNPWVARMQALDILWVAHKRVEVLDIPWVAHKPVPGNPWVARKLVEAAGNLAEDNRMMAFDGRKRESDDRKMEPADHKIVVGNAWVEESCRAYEACEGQECTIAWERMTKVVGSVGWSGMAMGNIRSLA